ncbi:MAG TPA: hypothetical protein VGM23_03830 [Armatimonadota bacterium]|jgi:hypothetical protein
MEKSLSREPFTLRYGWLFLAVSALLGLGAAVILAIFPAPVDLPAVVNLTGHSWGNIVAQSPDAAKLIRFFISEFWIADATVYALCLALAVTVYRTGERWAWVLAAMVVLYGIVFIVTSAAAGGTMWPNWIVHLTLEVLGLALPYRKFFPKKAVPSLV